MTTSTWATGISGDWATAADWTGGVPNNPAADVVIDAKPTAEAYTVTIAAGESETVNTLSLNDVVNGNGVNQPIYNGASLEVDGTLTFAPGSLGGIDGALQTYVGLNSGTIVNAGTVQGFIVAKGTSEFTGSNGVYVTNAIQSLGTLTIDTSSIAEMRPSVLFDGIFEAKADPSRNYAQSIINLGGPLGHLIPDIKTIEGPVPTATTPNGWAQLIYNGTDPATALMEWNGTKYIPIESTLTTIGLNAIVTAQFGSQYATTNALTIEAGGFLEQTSGTLSTGGLTIDAGGILTNAISVGGASGTLTDSLDVGTLTVAGTVTNNGTVAVFSAPVAFRNAISGTGDLLFKSNGSLEVGSVSAGQAVTMIGHDTLILDTPAGFAGSVAATGTGNTIVLKGVNADSAVVVGNVLDVRLAGAVVDSVALNPALDGTGFALTEVNGNAQIVVGGQPASVPSVTAGASTTVTPGGAPGALDPSIVVTDAGQPTLAGATVAISSGFVAGDTLSVGPAQGVAVSYDAAQGRLSLTGTAPVAAYQALLAAVAFSTPKSASGADSARTITWSVNDGLLNSAASTSSLIVHTPPNVGAHDVLLTGDHDQYIVAPTSNGSAYVQDTVAGRDGDQTIAGLQHVLFADGTGVFDPTGAAEDVTRLYAAAFNRGPDLQGLDQNTALVTSGAASISQVALGFVQSPEFIADYGALNDTHFVTQLYQNALHRAPDAAGEQSWVAALQSGATRGAVLTGFAETEEAIQTTLPIAGDKSNSEVDRLYGAAFNRAPDAPGLAFWSSELTQGLTPQQVAGALANSAEFMNKYGALQSGDFVSAMYANALHRAPDSAGEQSWVNALNSGISRADVLLGFADSSESRIVTASTTHDGWVFVK